MQAHNTAPKRPRHQSKMRQKDSEDYLKKKRFFDSLLTVYGRLTALEALQTEGVLAHKLHLSKNNKPAEILDQLVELAGSKGAEIVYHDKSALSRISKNAKQDQGVALDLKPSGFMEFDPADSFQNLRDAEFIALDRVTNPQNLGMIIRSVCASPVRALIIPRKGCAKLDALVIKASAGTLFKAKILRCDSLIDVLESASSQGVKITGLDLAAKRSLTQLDDKSSARIFVLGNESEGISREVQEACTERVKIPMHNGVESLNVAVTASLIALRHQL